MKKRILKKRTIYSMHGLGRIGKNCMRQAEALIKTWGIPANRMKSIKTPLTFWGRRKIIKMILNEKFSPIILTQSNGGIQAWKLSRKLPKDSIRLLIICDSWIDGTTPDSVSEVVYYNSPDVLLSWLGTPMFWSKNEQLRTTFINMEDTNHVDVLEDAMPDIEKRVKAIL